MEKKQKITFKTLLNMSYDNFAKTFSKSRQNMKWPEIDYFFSTNINTDMEISILDIGCGNGRLLEYIRNYRQKFQYLWIDESSEMIKEAIRLYPQSQFLTLDMLDLNKINSKFDFIFFIASLHHLNTTEKRLQVLSKVKTLLKENWKIFLTNWNLLSENNFIKYKDSYNWNGDFNIKIWKFDRYYHAFETTELEDLFLKTGFKIVENKIFETERNIISIIKI